MLISPTTITYLSLSIAINMEGAIAMQQVMTKLDRFTALAKKVADFDKLPANVKAQFDNRAATVFCFNDLKDQEISETTAKYYLCAIID